jgi:predicted TIM-barrel fold metal-dependent hydrolase
MIVDVQTTIWPAPDDLGAERGSRLRGPVADRLTRRISPRAFDEAAERVDHTIVSGYRCERTGAHISDEWISEIVAHQPDRRTGVAGIDPTQADPVGAIRAAVDRGLRGICIAPAEQLVPPGDARFEPIFATCSELDIPLFVGSGGPMSEGADLMLARPALFDEVARHHPGLRILITSMGFPYIDETLSLIAKHAHVYASIAGVVNLPWRLYTTLQTASELGVIDKLLFGSNYPYHLPAECIEQLYTSNRLTDGSKLPTVKRTLLQAVLERDALQCLGMSPTMPAGQHLSSKAEGAG